MSCCMFTTMHQSESNCTHCIRSSKSMAGKCKHSDTKFTGSHKTKILEKKIKYQFPTSSTF